MRHGLRDLIHESDAPLDLILLSYHILFAVFGRGDDLLSYHVGEEEADDELTVVLVGGIPDVIDWQTHDHVVAICICCRISTASTREHFSKFSLARINIESASPTVLEALSNSFRTLDAS